MRIGIGLSLTQQLASETPPIGYLLLRGRRDDGRTVVLRGKQPDGTYIALAGVS